MSSIEIRVTGRYTIGKKIYEGPHSTVYIGKNSQSQKEVAIKCESKANQHKFLINQSTILSQLQGNIGIPDIKWHGPQEDHYFMITDLLGSNLEQCFERCQRQFSIKTVLMIADQVISNIQILHRKGYIHRDIKPQNFVMGLGKKLYQIYTIDLGMAIPFIDQETKKHIQQIKNRKSFAGSLRYASLNVHNGYLNTRRDDLESIGYMLIYFLNGSLPWSGFQSKSLQDSINHIKKLKDINPKHLCKDIPNVFQQYITYVKQLQYSDTPDYSYLKSIFRNKLISQGYQNDFIFDWILLPVQRQCTSVLNKSKIQEINNFSMCNYYVDPSQKDYIPKTPQKTPLLVQQKKTIIQSVPVAPPKINIRQKNKKDDCLLF